MPVRSVALAALLVVMTVAGGAAATARTDPAARTDAPSRPFVSAHRGGAAAAPENTMVAFRRAIALGVDQLEADAQLTADGAVILLHDDTLDRTTDCTGPVIEVPLADLARCDAAYWFSPGQPTTQPDEQAPHPLRGTGVRVPTAEELLLHVAALGADGPELSLEIKDIPGEANFDAQGTAVAEALVPLIERTGMTDRVVVQSFWPPALEAVQRMAPGIRTQFLTTSSTGQTAAQNLAYVISRDHDVSAPNHDAPDLTAELVASAHAAGKQVVPYTPDEEADLRAAIALGVDGIITNVPERLLTLLARGEGTAAGCADLRPARWRAATGTAAPGATLRVVAIQYKQDVAHVATYDAFRRKVRCLIEEHVVPVLRPGLPTLVALNEDIGLMTLATGTRGRSVREQATTPLRAPLGDAAPVAAASALAQLNAAYAPQVAEYQRRFGPIDPRKQVFVAATDTMARAYWQTMSELADEYDVHIVASNNMTPFEVSRDPVDIALFGDPDLPDVEEVYVATSQEVANRTAIWGPDGRLLFENEKVPLTSLEKDLLALDEGPATGPEARANAAGVEVAGWRLGFATSLPAFRWGHAFGEPPPPGDPCADVRETFVRCMDDAGVEVVVQVEANPGRWATVVPGGWQPLEWMESTWRHVADPTVDFAYNVTAHMVGNLLDIPFDGQTAITARHRPTSPDHYVGNTVFDEATDDPAYAPYVGDQPHFVQLAPWVVDDAPRQELSAVASKLAPGSGDPLENDYLETAVWADLVPVDRAGSAGERPDRRPLPATGGGLAAGVLLMVSVLLGRRR